MEIITHELPSWQIRKKRQNGAATYSQDIVKNTKSTWLELFGKDDSVILSTCPLFSDVPAVALKSNHYRLAIQYLHSYPYQNPIEYIRNIIDKAPFQADRYVFLTAYEAYFSEINNWADQNNLPVVCWLIPMLIDTTQILQLDTPSEKTDEKKIIYFGNLYKQKAVHYHQLRKVVQDQGFQIDVISNSRFNNDRKILSQTEIWQIISRYKYGIGVGRCAMEMYALGLKVLISGAHFGGLCMNETDFDQQHKTNINGRIITFSRSIASCLNALEYSYIPKIDSLSNWKDHRKRIRFFLDQ